MNKTSIPTEKKYALIGAGPAGLAGAKNLKQLGIPFDGYEAHKNVGGLWDIDNPDSTMYESAHLISSKTKTEFTDFPMDESVADFPHHSSLKKYFRDYSKHFRLYDEYTFNTRLQNAEKVDNGWELTFDDGTTKVYKGLILANGTLSHPNIPTFKGTFSGEIIHSCQYKSAAIFEGKRILIVGAGNSGCDIAVDAVHRSQKVAMSVRRGYHFVPKYVFGKPADTIGGKIQMPAFVKQKVEGALLKMFTGDPSNFGFPKPDHKLYESHPVVNSLVLYHAGHGDIEIKADIDHFEGKTVHFKDQTQEDFDLILLATGYKLNYPFLDKKHLNWQGACPDLYLNIFHPKYNNLFVLGMIEAAGIGWQGRDEQAQLVAQFIKAYESGKSTVAPFVKRKKGPRPDLSGGFQYIRLDRMSYYVHNDTYRKELKKQINSFA